MKRLFLVILILPVFFIACESETIPLTTNSEKARQEFLIARYLFEKLRYQDARPYLEKSIEEDSSLALAYLFLAQLETNTNERFALIEKAKSLSENVSRGERLIIMGFEAATFGYSKKQMQYFQELVEAYPNDLQALLTLANFYFGQREYDRALVYYKRMVQIDPSFSITYNQMGYVYRYHENYAAAEESFKKYIIFFQILFLSLSRFYHRL